MHSLFQPIALGKALLYLAPLLLVVAVLSVLAPSDRWLTILLGLAFLINGAWWVYVWRGQRLVRPPGGKKE